MTTPMQTDAEVAAKLTDKQRAALCDPWTSRSLSYHKMETRCRTRLFVLGLIDFVSGVKPPRIQRTASGLRVAQYLKQENAK